jgi:hypothetical protein
LSTDVLPQYVGQVSASGQGNSGVRFGGRVGLINGSLGSILGGYGGGYAMIAGNSQLIIQVIDYLPQYPDAPLIPPFIFGQAQGQIMGNQAQITFSDRYGQVTLQGYLNMQNNSFEGTISYDNNISIDGSTPGAAGTLGNFSVPICAFFACQ